MKKLLTQPFFIKLFNWEYWPFNVVYGPIYLYWFWLCIQSRSFFFFNAANPSIKNGGFLLESKKEIYDLIPQQYYPRTLFFHDTVSANELEQKLEKTKLVFPLIGKPDIGMRGLSVKKLENIDEVLSYAAESKVNFLIQEFIPLENEVGIFYYRYPSSDRGQIFSITEKQFPILIGNGRSTLEQLILNDSRAVCLAEKYFEQNRKTISEIPADGEAVEIVRIGTHSRGAIFTDGEWLKTAALENKIDEICCGYPGFNFGRFDIRAESFDDLRRGECFRIVELNGVTSESTNIYDPKYSLVDAYRILFDQWRIAFEIGAANRDLGAKTTSVSDLIRLIFGRKIQSDSSPADEHRPLTAGR